MASGGKSGAVQKWLESTVQGQLLGTEFGHHPGDREPDWLLADSVLRERAIGITMQLITSEHCARDAAAGLVGVAPDVATRLELATQIFDETRHLEVFGARLRDLGLGADRVEDALRDAGSSSLRRVARTLLEAIEQRDFAAAIFGLNVLFEPAALRLLERLHDAQAAMNPKFARTLAGVIADERRHVGFGERCVHAVLRDDAPARARLERMQGALAQSVLAAIAEQSAVTLERNQLIEELNMRLSRLGIGDPIPVES